MSRAVASTVTWTLVAVEWTTFARSATTVPTSTGATNWKSSTTAGTRQRPPAKRVAVVCATS